jgi:hypothetical protein
MPLIEQQFSQTDFIRSISPKKSISPTTDSSKISTFTRGKRKAFSVNTEESEKVTF